ncbi:MAG: hypothetical protein R3247_01720, partial [Rhodothermales bacterium]|nr:hypothetical protein [Rhodothermales bacterium]
MVPPDRIARAAAGVLAAATVAGIVFGAAALHTQKPPTVIWTAARDVPAFARVTPALLTPTTQARRPSVLADSSLLVGRHTATVVPARRVFTAADLLPPGLHDAGDTVLLAVADTSQHPFAVGEAAMLLVDVAGPAGPAPITAEDEALVDVEGAGARPTPPRAAILTDVMVVDERQFSLVVAVPQADVERLAPYLLAGRHLRVLPYVPRRMAAPGALR